MRIEPHYYIGQAEDIFDRWHSHCDGNQQYIDLSIKEYGCTKFVFRILEETSKSELDECETKWIKSYKEKFGEKQIYNISQTKNNNPHRLSKEVKNKIKQLFNDDIGRSIYAIAEKYDIKWKDVVDIRKPILRERGLEYGKKEKGIVEIRSRKTPENWRGYKITKSLSEKNIIFKKDNKDDKDIANECNISTTDLAMFYEEYQNKQYEFAPII